MSSINITIRADLADTIGIAPLNAADHLVSGLASSITVKSHGPEDLYTIPDLVGNCKYSRVDPMPLEDHIGFVGLSKSVDLNPAVSHC